MAPVVLSCLVCGTSCSSHVEGGSLPSMLDSADNYIAAGDARSAIAILDQAASQAEGNYESLAARLTAMATTIAGKYNKPSGGIPNVIPAVSTG